MKDGACGVVGRETWVSQSGYVWWGSFAHREELILL